MGFLLNPLFFGGFLIERFLFLNSLFLNPLFFGDFDEKSFFF
ncbi:hypothetical protein HMPREF1408_01125 [Helicobacter pylori GAM245Ai]|nr:hypothetical protein HMPREF1408_01125 [Helicobacter pylori GAM245Ai]